MSYVKRLMNHSQDKFLLARSREIPDPGSLSFRFERESEYIEGFLLKKNKEYRAYLNRCPHTGVNLNWNPHDFFDLNMEFIQCSMHGALFQPLDGLCIHGPCVNQSLTALDLVIESGQIYLLLPCQA